VVQKQQILNIKNLTSFIKHVRPTTPIKPQISFFASVMGLGYNKNVIKNVIISKADYTSKKIFAQGSGRQTPQ